MLGRRVEAPHNTDEQVAEYLSKALALVDELDVPDDLRRAAFVKAADLYANKAITVEQVVPGDGLMGIPRG